MIHELTKNQNGPCGHWTIRGHRFVRTWVWAKLGQTQEDPRQSNQRRLCDAVNDLESRLLIDDIRQRLDASRFNDQASGILPIILLTNVSDKKKLPVELVLNPDLPTLDLTWRPAHIVPPKRIPSWFRQSSRVARTWVLWARPLPCHTIRS